MSHGSSPSHSRTCVQARVCALKEPQGLEGYSRRQGSQAPPAAQHRTSCFSQKHTRNIRVGVTRSDANASPGVSDVRIFLSHSTSPHTQQTPQKFYLARSTSPLFSILTGGGVLIALVRAKPSVWTWLPFHSFLSQACLPSCFYPMA